MREIKFRGKRVDNGNWVYGSLVVHNQLECSIIDYASYEKESYNWQDVTPESVGQYTGLKDKNGKDIYEGDVVHFDDTPYCVSGLKIDGKIVYYKGSWSIEYQATFTKDFHLMRKLFSSEDFIGSKSEIIGNIHEQK